MTSGIFALLAGHRVNQSFRKAKLGPWKWLTVSPSAKASVDNMGKKESGQGDRPQDRLHV